MEMRDYNYDDSGVKETVEAIMKSNLNSDLKEGLESHFQIFDRSEALDRAINSNLLRYILFQRNGWKITYPTHKNHYSGFLLIKGKWAFSVIVGERFPKLGPIWLECDCCCGHFHTIDSIIKHLEKRKCIFIDITKKPPKEYSLKRLDL